MAAAPRNRQSHRQSGHQPDKWGQTHPKDLALHGTGASGTHGEHPIDEDDPSPQMGLRP
jgi:hypothetical protein